MAVLWECLRVGHKYSLLAVAVGCYGNEAYRASFLFDEALLWLLQNTNDANGCFFCSFIHPDVTLNVRLDFCSRFTLIGWRESADITFQIGEDVTMLCIESKCICFFFTQTPSPTWSTSEAQPWAGELCRNASGYLESLDGKRSRGGRERRRDEQQKERGNKRVHEWEKASRTDALRLWLKSEHERED